MKLKTIIELLTLSTTLYTISRDEKLMNDIQTLASKGKDNLDKLMHEFSKNEYDEYDEEDEDKRLINKVLAKAAEFKVELDQKVEETAIKIYEKMHIAHANDLKLLSDEVEKLKADIALKEQRIAQLEQKTI